MCEDLGTRDHQGRRQPERQRREHIDRTTEGDQARDARGLAIRRGLIREHATLRVTREMDVFPTGLDDQVDGTAHGHDVVGEGPLHAALFGVR